MAIEAVTCVMRFGFGLESTRDTAALGSLTGGIRIHHSYIGALMLIASWFMRRDTALRAWCLRLGAALLLSDLIHHFGVLWLTEGDPQFDLTYPGG